MDNEVQQRVLKVFCEVLERKEDEIQLDASIRSDLLLDSLKQMTLFIALEDEFQRTIPLEVVVGLDTVKDIIDFVVKKVLEEPSAA